MWLGPRLAGFAATHPGIAIELETNHRGVDPELRDFDVWLAYSGEIDAVGYRRQVSVPVLSAFENQDRNSSP